MPYYSFKEIWTPLSIFRIKFYRETLSGTLFIKVKSRPRRKLWN